MSHRKAPCIPFGATIHSFMRRDLESVKGADETSAQSGNERHQRANLTSTARCQTHDAKVMEARRRPSPMRSLIATSSMPRPLAHDADKPASIEGDNKYEETGCYRGFDVRHALSTPNCEQPQRTNSRAKSRPDRCEAPLRGPWQTPGPARRHPGSQGQHNQTGGEQVHSTGSLAQPPPSRRRWRANSVH